MAKQKNNVKQEQVKKTAEQPEVVERVAENVKPAQKSPKKGTVLLKIAIIVVVSAGGLAAFEYMEKHNKNRQTLSERIQTIPEIEEGSIIPEPPKPEIIEADIQKVESTPAEFEVKPELESETVNSLAEALGNSPEKMMENRLAQLEGKLDLLLLKSTQPVKDKNTEIMLDTMLVLQALPNRVLDRSWLEQLVSKAAETGLAAPLGALLDSTSAAGYVQHVDLFEKLSLIKRVESDAVLEEMKQKQPTIESTLLGKAESFLSEFITIKKVNPEAESVVLDVLNEVSALLEEGKIEEISTILENSTFLDKNEAIQSFKSLANQYTSQQKAVKELLLTVQKMRTEGK